MDIVCKEKHNVIFWRNTPAEEWSCEDLDVMVNTYEKLVKGETDSYTELEYFAPVKRDGTDDILYHIFKCRNCAKTILTVDANHEYKYCPHCGAAIRS